MKKRGFTLIELLVVIAIIAMLLAILMPALSKVKKIAMRVVCGTNLKGLGTAQTVYANDYEDDYAVQGQKGAHTWSNFTKEWNLPTKVWSTGAEMSIGASLYLLVREADVSPKSFVCPSSDQKAFDGVNPTNLDIVQLWDFGHFGTTRGPENCVSYSYHQPYTAGSSAAATKSKFSANGTRSAAFAVMADQNLFFENPKLTRGGTLNADTYKEKAALLGAGSATAANIDNDLERWQLQIANALPHDRESQNVLFADGHTGNETRSDVGIKYDNIYTSWLTLGGAGALDRRTGRFMPADKNVNSVPQGMDDSVLVNDGPVVETGS